MNPIKKAALSGAVIAVTLALAAPGALSEIVWIKGYDRGLQAAKSAGKPAMIDFTAKWCGWCVKLDKNTFTNSRVQRLAESFVCVKVDYDKEPKKVRQWGIRGIPHILFLDPDGNLLGRIIGYKGPDQFAPEMESALRKFTPKRKRRERRRAPRQTSESSSSESYFVECAKCGSIFNTITKKGECARCGAPYVVQ